MSEHFDLANLCYRDRGTYAAEELCLVCKQIVNPNEPHIFVRDADQDLVDNDALVGLLHPQCEQRYLADAAAAGIDTA